MPSQLVRVDPTTVVFSGPFTKPVKSVLAVTNLVKSVVAFKLRVTHPEQYNITPNCGFVEPKSTVAAEIVVLPFAYDKKKQPDHRFLILARRADGEKADADAKAYWAKCKDESTFKMVVDSKFCLKSSQLSQISSPGESLHSPARSPPARRKSTTSFAPMNLLKAKSASETAVERLESHLAYRLQKVQ